MGKQTRSYIAHLILRVVYKDPRPDESIPLWENLHLIRAADDHEAFQQAEHVGRQSEVLDDFFCDDHPATLRFVGVRKMKLISAPLRHGLELTDMQLEVASEQDLAALMANQTVGLVCYDDFGSPSTAPHTPQPALPSPKTTQDDPPPIEHPSNHPTNRHQTP